MSNTIYLNDLLNLSDDVLRNTKIRFIQSKNDINMISDYLSDHNKISEQALFWREKQRYFKVGQIAICLLELKNDYWLLTTIKKITKEKEGVTHGINYEAEEMNEFRKYFGHVIIKYHKERPLHVYAYNGKDEEPFIKRLEVKEDIGQYFE